MIESGAIVHAFVGEKAPSAGSIMSLIKKTFSNTNCAQMTISPELTICLDCAKLTRGLHEKCLACGSDNVDPMTRIVGYYSSTNHWNKSKKREQVDRSKGNYAV